MCARARVSVLKINGISWANNTIKATDINGALCAYWCNEYCCRSQQKKINALSFYRSVLVLFDASNPFCLIDICLCCALNKTKRWNRSTFPSSLDFLCFRWASAACSIVSDYRRTSRENGAILFGILSSWDTILVTAIWRNMGYFISWPDRTTSCFGIGLNRKAY